MVVPFAHPDPAARAARARVLAEGGRLTDQERAEIQRRLEDWEDIGGGGGKTGNLALG